MTRRRRRAALLLIDNYDSFTYNLVQAFLVLGAEVIVRRNDAITVERRWRSRRRICASRRGPARRTMPACRWR
jgi:anthranilate/para-aminobenzoate synthase component II